jgi:hypothetical protein
MAIKRFQDVTQKALEVVLAGLQEPSFAYRSLFPAQFTSNLSWESLEADGDLTISADVIAHDSSARLKKRPDAAMQTGAIEKISLLNQVSEKQLHNLYALQNSPRGLEAQIYKIIFGDVGRSYRGVHMRLEEMAMQALSTGIVDITSSNNIGVLTKATFGIPSGNKKGAAVIWSTAATAKPIADLKERVRYAKGKGYKVQAIYMEETTFDLMRATTEVKEQYSGLLGLSVGYLSPTLEQINVILNSNGLPPIVIIDSTVTIEGKDGSLTTYSPWSTGKVAFLSSPTAGSTQFTLTAEEKVEGYADPAAMAANRDIVRITRWNDRNPFRVYTKGESVAFPTLNNVKGIFLLNTLNATTWS